MGMYEGTCTETHVHFYVFCFYLLRCFLLLVTAIVVWMSSRSEGSTLLSTLLTSTRLSEGFLVFFGVCVAVQGNHCKYLSSTCPRQSQSSNPYWSHTHPGALTHTHTHTHSQQAWLLLALVCVMLWMQIERVSWGPHRRTGGARRKQKEGRKEAWMDGWNRKEVMEENKKGQRQIDGWSEGWSYTCLWVIPLRNIC